MLNKKILSCPKFKLFVDSVRNIRILIAALIFSMIQSAGAYGFTDDDNGNISGKVLDFSNNEPVEFATVSVYTADSVLVTGNITSVDGTFNIQVPDGRYYLKVQFISYQHQTVKNVSITRENRKVDLGEYTPSARYQIDFRGYRHR